jgi:putative ABC transport system substrate-binding protein
MKRRDLIGALSGTAASWPLLAHAQSAARIPSIGVLSPFSQAGSAEWHESLRRGLRALGWIEGSNIHIEYRYADGNADHRLDELLAELLALKLDLLVTEVTEATTAAQRATTTIPIVMVAVGDPVKAGIVRSLARPGGNITGLSQNIIDSAGKRLELLKQVVPSLADVSVLSNPADENSMLNQREVETSARHLGLRMQTINVDSSGALNKALTGGIDARLSALYIVPSPLFVTNLKSIAEFALRHRLPSIFHLSDYVRLGGLMAYGPDRNDIFRRAAAYVDKILKGAKPADLPVEQPTKLELSINLGTAGAIGVTIPPLVLARADEVID